MNLKSLDWISAVFFYVHFHFVLLLPCSVLAYFSVLLYHSLTLFLHHMDFIQIQLKARTSAQHVYMHPKAQPEVKIPPPPKKNTKVQL